MLVTILNLDIIDSYILNKLNLKNNTKIYILKKFYYNKKEEHFIYVKYKNLYFFIFH